MPPSPTHPTYGAPGAEPRRLSPADYRTMPWKNGRGSTVELLIDPPGAVMGSQLPFDLRVSLATLEAPPGRATVPFSTFAGYDRVILQTAGRAMRLTHGAAGSHQLTPLVPYRFAGEWSTEGELDGPATDFNVMTRRGATVAHVEVLELPREAAFAQARTADGLFVYLLAGELAAPLALTPGDSLVAARADTPLRLHAVRDATVILVMVRTTKS